MAVLTAGTIPLNTDQLNIAKVQYGQVTVADTGRIRFTYSDGSADDVTGVGFTYSSTGALTGGVVTGVLETQNGKHSVLAAGFQPGRHRLRRRRPVQQQRGHSCSGAGRERHDHRLDGGRRAAGRRG